MPFYVQPPSCTFTREMKLLYELNSVGQFLRVRDVNTDVPAKWAWMFCLNLMSSTLGAHLLPAHPSREQHGHPHGTQRNRYFVQSCLNDRYDGGNTPGSRQELDKS